MQVIQMFCLKFVNDSLDSFLSSKKQNSLSSKLIILFGEHYDLQTYSTQKVEFSILILLAKFKEESSKVIEQFKSFCAKCHN